MQKRSLRLQRWQTPILTWNACPRDRVLVPEHDLRETDRSILIADLHLISEYERFIRASLSPG